LSFDNNKINTKKKMGLQKGMTNNIKGRPVGSLNKVTVDLKLRISDFLENNWDTLQDDFDQLAPRDKVYFREKLMQYRVPKQQATQITSDLSLENYSEQQLDILIERIKHEENS
jgi:hypothetical protein